MRDIERRAVEAYCTRFGVEPEVVASAPGRVNLIGEHTDYNGGFVLPCAIDRRVAVALSEGGGELYSADFQQTQALSGCDRDTWAAYPRGVAWALAEAGYDTPSFQAAFAGDVPLGAGLSSSAAIEAASALALVGRFGFDISKRELARICQQAENRFVGVKSGIMDQYASLLGQTGAALLIDCRSLDAEPIPLDLEQAHLILLVCNTGVKRSLAQTGYNERRADCEEAAQELGVTQLRDATLDDLRRLDGRLLQRARHVVTENGRVLAAARAMRRRNFQELGRLMFASHTSLRFDYEVSTPELDTFVDVAREAGALGARLTGAGFGGCAIGLISSEMAEDAIAHTGRAFAERGFKEPTFYAFRPSEGADVRRL